MATCVVYISDKVMVMTDLFIYSNVTHLFLGKELHEKSIGHEQEKIKGTLYNLENAQITSSQSHSTLTGLNTIWIMIDGPLLTQCFNYYLFKMALIY